jgi:hypothetical protein
MEPTLPEGSQSLFSVEVQGSYSGRVVCVGRFTNCGPLESHAVGILAVVNPEAGWSEQGLRLDFLNRAGESLLLNEDRYRVTSEWLTVWDVAAKRPHRTGGFSPPATAQVPQLDQRLAMTKDQIVRTAASFATPPEVFSKYPELVNQNPTLSQIVMTNFLAFRRWIYLQPTVLQELTIAGQSVKVPGGSPLSRMVVKEWLTRGEAFKQWYYRVIEPMYLSSSTVVN